MQEQIDGRVIDVMRKLQREAQDDEYESSTPAAGRWRERTAAWRRDRTQTAATVSGDDDPGADDATTRLAQRHRFGRTLDLPPAEPWPERGLIRWAFWLLVAGALATLIACLT